MRKERHIYLERPEPGAKGIPAACLEGHTAVLGTCGTGKTTTIKRLLAEAYRSCRLPFLVLEWGRGEYADLVESVPSLRVYTTEADGLPLNLNPLQPEEGIRIGEHAAAVARMLADSSGGKVSREMYQRLLLSLYRQFGWDSGQTSCLDPFRPFPTLWDMGKWLESGEGTGMPEMSERREICRHLWEVLEIGRKNLYEGCPRQYFKACGGLTAAELLEAPAVLELDAFSGRAAVFLRELLLFRLRCALSRMPAERRRKRLLAMEGQVPETALAGFRGLGAGWVFSQEHPAELGESLLENIQVRIVHALISERDRRCMEAVLGQPVLSCRGQRDIRPGACLVSVAGEKEARPVQVYPEQAAQPARAACLVCPGRQRCRRAEVERLLEQEGPGRLALLTERLKVFRFHPRQAVLYLERWLETGGQEGRIPGRKETDTEGKAALALRCCLLGELLSRIGGCSFGEIRSMAGACRLIWETGKTGE